MWSAMQIVLNVCVFQEIVYLVAFDDEKIEHQAIQICRYAIAITTRPHTYINQVRVHARKNTPHAERLSASRRCRSKQSRGSTPSLEIFVAARRRFLHRCTRRASQVPCQHIDTPTRGLIDALGHPSLKHKALERGG
jgi:hypothetical protein